MIEDFLRSMHLRKGSDLHVVSGIRRECASTAI